MMIFHYILHHLLTFMTVVNLHLLKQFPCLIRVATMPSTTHHLRYGLV